MFLKKINLFKIIIGLFVLVSLFVLIRFNLTKNLKGICRNCNVLIIDIDVFRADAIDCESKSEITPNICKFLKKSAYFKNNISHSDLTRPAFVSGLTSLYPSSHQSWNRFFGDLDPEILTLPKILKQHSYQTIFVGNPPDNQLSLNDFDQRLNIVKGKQIRQYFTQGDKPFLLYFYIGALHFPYVGCGKDETTVNVPPGLPRTQKEIDRILAEYVVDHYKEIFRPETITLYPQLFQRDLTKKKDEIFALYQKLRFTSEGQARFLISAWKPVEQSYTQDLDANNPEHLAYLKSLYMKCLKYVDKEILPTLLNDSMLFEKTIIVIKSDHGEEFYEHKKCCHGNNLYQELIATPLIIQFPGSKFMEIKALTQDIDIVPTLLDFLGTSLYQQFQGKSLIPLMENPQRTGDDYQIAQKGPGHITSFRKHSWKLILQNNQPFELYNLSDDPGEKNNMVEKNKEKTRELLEEYKKILSSHKVYKANRLFQEEISPERLQRLINEGYF